VLDERLKRLFSGFVDGLENTAPESDPLSDLIRQGAHGQIARAVDAELAALLGRYADLETEDGRPAVTMSSSRDGVQVVDQADRNAA